MENTENAGAEPGNTESTEKTGAEPVLDAKAESSTENVPWNKDPRFQEFNKNRKEWTASHEKLQKILKANNLEDPDDLDDIVDKGLKVKGKAVDVDRIDELVKDSQLLKQYQAYWAEQEEKKRRETEDPDSTIARLEGMLKSKNVKEQQRDYERHQAEQAKQAIQGYDNEVKNLIKEMEMPKDQQGFILEFMGVGNPANDIDITDRKAIKRLVVDASKKKAAYDQAVIANYLKGKGVVPKVGSSSTGAPETRQPQKSTFKDLRRQFLEGVQGTRGG